MYNVYLFGLVFVHALGFNNATVRFARHLWRSRTARENQDVRDAIRDFFLSLRGPLWYCEDCGAPILARNDSFHRLCRTADEIMNSEVTETHREVAHVSEAAAFFASLCGYPECWEVACVGDYCEAHACHKSDQASPDYVVLRAD